MVKIGQGRTGASHGDRGGDAPGSAHQGGAADSLALVEDAATARLALSPFRRKLLERLRTPASAAALAEEMNLPRQRIGYHLRVLEEAGLIAEVETRQRRGFTERLLEARSDALILDPMILSPADSGAVEKQDKFAADHLVRTAAGIVREVSRMQQTARAEGSRLLTFTIEADVAFAAPSDIALFTDRLGAAVAGLAAEFAPATDGRAYRVTIGGHPAAGAKAMKKSVN